MFGDHVAVSPDRSYRVLSQAVMDHDVSLAVATAMATSMSIGVAHLWATLVDMTARSAN